MTIRRPRETRSSKEIQRHNLSVNVFSFSNRMAVASNTLRDAPVRLIATYERFSCLMRRWIPRDTGGAVWERLLYFHVKFFSIKAAVQCLPSCQCRNQGLGAKPSGCPTNFFKIVYHTLFIFGRGFGVCRPLAARPNKNFLSTIESKSNR